MKRAIFAAVLCMMTCFVRAGGESPIRIVSLSPALTELICALGGADRLVGRSSACVEPADVVASLPSCGDFSRPNAEAVLRTKPTHLLANDLIDPGMRRVFERAGIRTTIRQCRSFDDCRAWIRLIGGILNAPEAASREERRFDQAQKELSARPPLHLRVLWVIWDSPTIVAGPDSLPDEVLRLCGAENAAAGAKSEYFKCPLDWIARNQPDVLIWSAAPRDWKNDRFWSRLSAAKAGRMILLDYDDPTLRPGPGLPDAVRSLRAKLESMK